MPRNLNSVLLSRFQDQPALLEEGRTGWFEGCMTALNERMGEIEKADAAALDGDDFWPEADSWMAYLRPYRVKNGILHIPVKGVLLNNFPYAFGSWATGYEYIWEAVKRGVDDRDVKGIALVIESGGGMVAGNWDLCDRIYNARGTKPIKSFAAEYAYSAAYNIAAAGDDITVARTGGVGSIGVVVVHMEISKMLEAEGVTTTIFRSNPDKMEGNPYETLSEGAKARIQERVDEFHTQFVTMVARNRDMEASAVQALTSRTYMAQQAIDNGLADAISNLDDAITAFVANVNSEGDGPMANEKAEFTKDQYDAAVAAATEAAKAEGVKEGKALGAAEATTRFKAILDSDEGKKRPKAALSAALKTSMSVEDATAFLADLAEEKVETKPQGTGVGAGRQAFETAMGEGSGLTAGEGGDDEGDQKPTRAQRAQAMARDGRPKATA